MDGTSRFSTGARQCAAVASDRAHSALTRKLDGEEGRDGSLPASDSAPQLTATELVPLYQETVDGAAALPRILVWSASEVAD